MNLNRCFVLLSVLVGGCAVSPFYNEGRDKQGQALVRAAGKVEMVSTIDAVDRRFAALRTLELETSRARAATQRELEISFAASPGPDGKGTLKTRYVQPLLEQRIQRLAGKFMDDAGLDALLADEAERESRNSQLQSALRTFNAVSSLNLKDCPAARAVTGTDGKLKTDVRERVEQDHRSSADALLKVVGARCALPTAFVGDPGGEHFRLSGELAETSQRATGYRLALERHRADQKQASARYQAEVEAATPKSGDATATAQMKSAAATLSSALGVLRESAKLSADAFGHAQALERVEALDAVISAVAGGSTDLTTLSGEQQKAVGVVRAIGSIADEIDSAIAAARKPRLAPLLLALEQQRLVVKGYEEHAALLDRRVTLRRQQLAALESELRALARARRALGPPQAGSIGATVDNARLFADAAVDGGDGALRKVALYTSLASYFDLALHHRQRTAELEMAFNATSDEQVMLVSRTAAAQWTSVLQQMAAVLAEHHAAGIKPAELAEFLKGFGLVTIGARIGQ